MRFSRVPFHSLTLVGPALLTLSSLHASVTFVDPVDIAIPFNFGGVYLDLNTGNTANSTLGGTAASDSYTISYSQPAAGDWDLNFFFGGTGIAHNSSLQPYRGDGSDNLSAIHNVEAGSIINGGPITPEPATGISTILGIADFGGSGTGSGGGLDGTLTETHMGPADNQFETETSGFIAFVLDPGTPTQTFGWISVSLSNDGTTGFIREWAYSDSPLEVGAIPEPGTFSLVMIAGLALLRRRR